MKRSVDFHHPRAKVHRGVQAKEETVTDATDEVRFDLCGAFRSEEACTTPSRKKSRVAYSVDSGTDCQAGAGAVTNKSKGNDGTFAIIVKERASIGAG